MFFLFINLIDDQYNYALLIVDYSDEMSSASLGIFIVGANFVQNVEFVYDLHLDLLASYLDRSCKNYDCYYTAESTTTYISCSSTELLKLAAKVTRGRLCIYIYPGKRGENYTKSCSSLLYV